VEVPVLWVQGHAVLSDCRSRVPFLEGWNDHVDELRHFVYRVQRAEEEPYSGRSGHEAHQEANVSEPVALLGHSQVWW